MRKLGSTPEENWTREAAPHIGPVGLGPWPEDGEDGQVVYGDEPHTAATGHTAADPRVPEVFAQIHIRPASGGSGFAWDSVLKDGDGGSIDRSYGSEHDYATAATKASAHITGALADLTRQYSGPAPWELNGPWVER